MFTLKTTHHKDHTPPHVHVKGSGFEAKIDILSFKVLNVRGFTKRDINMIVKYMKENIELIIEAWEEYNEE